MKKKAYLELGITLIIGFMIGFFVNSIITDKRIKEFTLHQGEWNFWRRALVEINASPEQREAIAPIVRKYTNTANSIMHQSWEKVVPIMDEMEKKIFNELTPKQQKDILDLKEQRSRMRQNNIRQNQEHYNKDHKNKESRHHVHPTHKEDCEKPLPPPKI